MTQQDLSILLVENTPVDIDLTIRAFKKNNFTNLIAVARDGEEAISWISRWKQGEQVPAVILLDLKFPKINGLEVLERIKSHKTSKTIPVVVLTSSSSDIDIEAAYKLGANSYIVKPVDFKKLVDVQLK